MVLRVGSESKRENWLGATPCGSHETSSTNRNNVVKVIFAVFEDPPPAEVKHKGGPKSVVYVSTSLEISAGLD